MSSNNGKPERPRTKEQNIMYSFGVTVVVAVTAVFAPIGLAVVVGLLLAGKLWQGPLLVLDQDAADATRQRWVKALASPGVPKPKPEPGEPKPFKFGWLGLNNPDLEPKDRSAEEPEPGPMWPPLRVSSWWALLTGSALAVVEVVLGRLAVLRSLSESIGYGRGGLLVTAGFAAGSFVFGFVAAQMWSSARRRVRHSVEMSPVAIFGPNLLVLWMENLPALIGAGAMTAVLAGGVAWFVELPIWLIAAVAVVSALVGAAVSATKLAVAAVCVPWLKNIATRDKWQERWMQMLPGSKAPPVWNSQRMQPNDEDPTHVIEVFSGTPGTSFENYADSRVTEGMQAALGAPDMLLYQLPGLDASGSAVPGKVHPSGFALSYSLDNTGQVPYLAADMDNLTRKFHLRREITKVFLDMKLGRPLLVGVPRVLTTPDSSGVLIETQWHPPQATTTDQIVAMSEAMAEKIGVDWVRIGQRSNNLSGGQRSPLVSVLLGTAPATWTLQAPAEATLRVIDAMDVEAAFVANRLARPQMVSTRRVCGEDPQIRRAAVELGGCALPDIVKALPKLEARLGTVVVEAVPAGHRLDSKSVDLWWFPDELEPDAHLDISLPMNRRLPSARAALLRAMAVKGLGVAAVTEIDLMDTESETSDAVRALVLLPEGVSHRHLLESRGQLAEELRCQDLVISRIPTEFAEMTESSEVEQKYAVVWFSQTSLSVSEEEAAAEILEGRWDSWWSHPKVKVVDNAGGTPRLVNIEALPGDVSRHIFTKVGGFTSEDMAKIRDSVKELLGVEYLMIDYQPPGEFRVDVAQQDPIPTIAPLPRMEANTAEHPEWHYMPMGLDAKGDCVGWDLKMAPHSLITGQTGSGKSVQLQALVYGALSRGFRVHIADPTKEGADFVFAERHCESFISTLEGTAQLLERVYAIVSAQKKIRRQHGAGAWYDLPEDIRPIPHLVLIDEFFSLVMKSAGKSEENQARNEVKENILDLVGRLAREARAAGVHLALVAQRPDASVMKGEMRFNLGARVLCGKASKVDLNMALRTPSAYDADLIQPPGKEEPIKGRGVIDVEGTEACVFQGFYEGDLPGLTEDFDRLGLKTFDHAPTGQGETGPEPEAIKAW